MAALVGVNELMMGAGMNVKPLSVALPPLVINSREPEDPLPTVANTVEEVMRLKEATKLPPSLMEVISFKFAPVIVMMFPLPAALGEKSIRVGGAINKNPSIVALPPGVVTASVPDDPVPTSAKINVEETTVKEATGVPPSEMADASER